MDENLPRILNVLSLVGPSKRTGRRSHETFGYKDFIPSLTAARFDPDAWATQFHQAGTRYVVPVAEHHDGFAGNHSPSKTFVSRRKEQYSLLSC